MPSKLAQFRTATRCACSTNGRRGATQAGQKVAWKELPSSQSEKTYGLSHNLRRKGTHTGKPITAQGRVGQRGMQECLHSLMIWRHLHLTCALGLLVNVVVRYCWSAVQSSELEKVFEQEGLGLRYAFARAPPVLSPLRQDRSAMCLRWGSPHRNLHLQGGLLADCGPATFDLLRRVFGREL